MQEQAEDEAAIPGLNGKELLGQRPVRAPDYNPEPQQREGKRVPPEYALVEGRRSRR